MNLIILLPFLFLGDFDDFRLSINVCTIWCFYLGFRNSRQALRGYGGTIKDMSHTQDVTHPHPLLAAGVPATPQNSTVVTSND